MIKRKGGRRKGSILSLETVRQTIRIQSNLKGDPRESSFSILKQKNFFKFAVFNSNEAFGRTRMRTDL